MACHIIERTSITNKFVESGGKINAIRMELQSRKTNAAHIFEPFLELPDSANVEGEF